MSAAVAELAELRERVDLIDAILRALGVPLDELGPMIAEDHAKLKALSAGLSAAFRYAGMPVPKGLYPEPRSRSHLRVIKDGDQ